MASLNEYESDDYLLTVIPSHLCDHRQVARWNHERSSPTYKLRRRPTSLKELNKYDYGIAIWRNNETLTYVTPRGSDDLPEDGQKCLLIDFADRGLSLNITGIKDEAVADTADFFMSLDKPTRKSSCLVVGSVGMEGFDFRRAQLQCLSSLFAPSRAVGLRNLTLSAAQSVILTTAPHEMRLTLYHCTFEDGGAAFVDSLENRDSSFGSLAFQGGLPLNDDNLKRLLQGDMLGYLMLPELNDGLDLLPFSAKVNHLDYEISSSSLTEANLKSLNIVTNKFAFTIIEDAGTFPTESVLIFLRRLAVLGHFVDLKVRFVFDDNEVKADIPHCVVQQVIRTALANSKLELLDLSTNGDDVEWDMHMKTVFKGLKDHKGLRKLRLSVDDSAFGPSFCHLRQFLSDNRYITVMDEDDEIYTDDDGVIDALYSLNRFYQGSADKMTKPVSERSLLVATTLTEVASKDFQRSALLLSDHADALYELVKDAQLDQRLSQPLQGNVPKRVRRI